MLCKNNCGRSIKRGKIDSHIQEDCPLQLVECPNKGESLFEEGCSVKVKRREMDQHKQVCTFRKVQCANQGCLSWVVFKDLATHDQRCLFKVIECDNKCGQKIQRQALDRHTDICEF